MTCPIVLAMWFTLLGAPECKPQGESLSPICVSADRSFVAPWIDAEGIIRHACECATPDPARCLRECR